MYQRHVSPCLLRVCGESTCGVLCISEGIDISRRVSLRIGGYRCVSEGVAAYRRVSVRIHRGVPTAQALITCTLRGTLNPYHKPPKSILSLRLRDGSCDVFKPSGRDVSLDPERLLPLAP